MEEEKGLIAEAVVGDALYDTLSKQAQHKQERNKALHF